MAKATAAMKLADIESAVVQLAEQLGTEFEGDEQVEQVLLTPPLSSLMDATHIRVGSLDAPHPSWMRRPHPRWMPHRVMHTGMYIYCRSFSEGGLWRSFEGVRLMMMMIVMMFHSPHCYVCIRYHNYGYGNLRDHGLELAHVRPPSSLRCCTLLLCVAWAESHRMGRRQH